jgi:hypothetical protein
MRPGRERCSKNTRRELHGVKKLRPLLTRSCKGPLRRVIKFDQIFESASGILPSMVQWDSTAKDRAAHIQDRPMAYSKSLRAVIRGALASGALARNGVHRASGGPRKGQRCIACHGIIAQTQFAMQGIDDHGTTLQFHVECFSIWNIERTALAGVESGAQAVDGRLPPPEEEKEIRELKRRAANCPEIAPHPAA